MIAEVKKASPSAGLLREDYRPAEIALAYAEAGASGISVLTEPAHFLGSGAHLREVRRVVEIRYYNENSMKIVTLMDHQVWEYDAEGNTWYLITPLPAFR